MNRRARLMLVLAASTLPEAISQQAPRTTPGGRATVQISSIDRAFEALCNGRPEQAYRLFSAAAENGDVVAQWYAATRSPSNTQSMLSVITRPDVAIVVNGEGGKWMQRAANLGDPRATARLAFVYGMLQRYGRVPARAGDAPIDPEMAEDVRQKASQKAAELGSKVSQLRQNPSQGVLRSYKNAERLLLAIADRGNGAAAWELALLYAEPSAIANEASKEKWTQSAVSLNVPEALRARSADLRQTDSTRSLELLRQAASAGSVGAMTDLRFRYEFGDGVPKDSAQENYWLTRAAELGDFGSMTSLTLNLLNDPFRPEEAEKWALRAAALGPDQRKQVLGDFYVRLGEVYLQGLKADRDLDKAEKALKQSEGFGGDAHRDLARAQAFRGMYALAGFHEPQNFSRAASDFQACSKQDPVCAYYLGYIHEFGKGVLADPEAARHDYENAERFGLKKAVKRLADLYESEGNYLAAYAHLNAAAEKAPEFADRRDKIAERLSPAEIRSAQEQSDAIYRSRDPITKVPLLEQGMRGTLYMSDDSWITDKKMIRSLPPASPGEKRGKAVIVMQDADPDWIPQGLLSELMGLEKASRDLRSGAAVAFPTASDSADAKSAIDRIRAGAHQNLPGSSEIPPAQTGGCTSAFENRSSVELRVYFKGPSSNTIRLIPQATVNVSFLPGEYEIAAEALTATVMPFYGRQSVRAGACYNQSFWIQ